MQREAGRERGMLLLWSLCTGLLFDELGWDGLLSITQVEGTPGNCLGEKMT